MRLNIREDTRQRRRPACGRRHHLQQGLGVATAATLDGLARNAGDPAGGSRFIDQIMQMVSRAGSQNIIGSIASMVSGGPSGGIGDLVGQFSSLVFGSQQGQIANLVSQHSGLTGSSAGGGLVKLAAGLVLGQLARMHSTGSIDASNLAGTLRTEASNLGSYVPANVLASLGGAGHETLARGAAAERAAVAAGATLDRRTDYAPNVLNAGRARPAATDGNRWIVPALAALVVAVAIGWLVHRFAGPATPATAANEAAIVSESAPAARVSLALADGSRISVPADGVEVRLVRLLQNPATQASGGDWLNIDQLLFDPGQPTLQPQSNDQLDNIAAVLKAYPSAKFVVGGYTDDTGDPDANLKLSQARAQSVMTALIQRGVDPARLTAQGYGQENPVADNSTAQGRQLNRRIAIRVASE